MTKNPNRAAITSNRIAPATTGQGSGPGGRSGGVVSGATGIKRKKKRTATDVSTRRETSFPKNRGKLK